MKKITALILALLMAGMFASCGGSSGGSTDTAAEPNAGVGDIVFAVPDGWNVKAANEGTYISFMHDGSDVRLNISLMKEDGFADIKQYDESVKAEDLEEYFKSSNEETQKDLEKKNMELENKKVCDVDAYCYKTKNKDGDCAEMNTVWLKDGAIHYFSMSNSDNYDNEGNMKDDAGALSDDEVAAYEAALASVSSGDGEEYLKECLGKVDSVGAVTFEMPEGYSAVSMDDKYLTLRNDKGINISVFVNTEEDLQWMEDENGNHPASLAEEYAKRTEYIDEIDEMQKITIAGHDGFIDTVKAEDGNLYNVSAGFLADDGLYDISMGTDAWDENGNIKSDAAALTDADAETFKAFLDSLKME